MSLVSQGAFSLSSFPSVPGRRPHWSTASPKGTAGSCVMAPGPVPWHGLSFSGCSHPEVTPGLSLSILTPQHLSGTSSSAGSATAPTVLPVPQVTQGRVSQGRVSQFAELFCSPVHPGKDPSSLILVYQSGFCSCLPSRGCVRVGKLRHGAAARC